MAGQYDLVTAVSFNWRYSPWNLAAYKAIHEGELGQIRHIRTDWRIRITGDLESFLAKRAWQKNTDTGGGVMRQGGSHEFDLVRFLTGLDFSRAVGRLTYHPYQGTNADDGCSLIAELTNGALAEFRLMITTGQRERQIRLEGEEGSLLVTDESAIRQYRDDDQPLHLQIGDDDQIPEGEETLQYTWYRLIEEFCSAIKRGDTRHNTVPNLPTFADGLRSQELISAAEVSDAEMRWVQIDELQ